MDNQVMILHALLVKGLRIRHKSWARDDAFLAVENGNAVDEEGNKCNLIAMISGFSPGGWRLYDGYDPKTAKEQILDDLKEGKAVSHVTWTHDWCIKMEDGVILEDGSTVDFDELFEKENKQGWYRVSD